MSLPESVDPGWDRFVVPVFLLALAGMAARGTVAGPAIGGLALLLVTGRLIVWKASEDWRLAVLLPLALLARLCLVGLDELLGLFPKFDAATYHAHAAAVADGWWTGAAWAGGTGLKNQIFEGFVGVFYFLFGDAVLLGRIVNASVSILAVYFVYRIGRSVYGRRAGIAAGAALAFLPSNVRLHGELLRDPLILVLVTGVVFLVVERHILKPAGLLAGIGIALPLFWLRRGVLAVALVPVAVLLVHRFLTARPSWGERCWQGVRRARALSLAGISVLVAGVALSSWELSSLLQLVSGKAYFVDAIEAGPAFFDELRRPFEAGGSAYLTDYAFTSWWSVLLFVPLGAAYFLFTPFPWQIHNTLSLAASLENLLVFYPVVLLGLWGCWRRARRAPLLPLAAFLVAGATLFGLAEGNVGTAMRHRVHFAWVFFVLAGPALVERYDAFSRWLGSGSSPDPS